MQRPCSHEVSLISGLILLLLDKRIYSLPFHRKRRYYSARAAFGCPFRDHTETLYMLVYFIRLQIMKAHIAVLVLYNISCTENRFPYPVHPLCSVHKKDTLFEENVLEIALFCRNYDSFSVGEFLWPQLVSSSIEKFFLEDRV